MNEKVEDIEMEKLEPIDIPTDKSLKEIEADKALKLKKEKLAENAETKAAAQKIDADPNLRYQHPLMSCEMNLMEISHRVVEDVEKAKYRIVGKSTGDFEQDKADFLKVLANKIVKFN